jgi:hypothetical protein
LLPPASPTLSLSGMVNAEAVWLVTPTDSASIAEGFYDLSVSLDTTTDAVDGTWSGVVNSSGASVQLQNEPATLTSEQEAAKYLAISTCARLLGDMTGAAAALDTLINHQPDVLAAYVEKAELLAGGGDYAGALAPYQQALDKLQARNPTPAEPLTLFVAPMKDLAAKLATQQQAAARRPK